MKKFIVFVLVMIFLFTTNTFSQLSGYKYEYPIYVKNLTSSTLTDYAVKIVFNTQVPIGLGWIQSDGRDIRFVSDCNGTLLYPYWLEGYLNTDTTSIYVKINSIPANDSVLVYMYCGNPATTSASTIAVFSGPHSATDSVVVASTNTVSNCQRGFRFTPNQDIIISHFGKRIPNATQRYVTLFDFNTQAIIAQIQVDPGTIGSYNYNELTSPIFLQSGRTCILALFNATSDMYYYGTSSQIGQHLTYHDMKYANNCTQNTFPTSTLANYHYGTPDFLYFTKQTVTPEPTFNVQLPSDTVTPAAPTGLDAMPGNTQAALVWSKNSEFDMLRYLIYRNTVNNPNTATLVDSVAHPDTMFVNTGLTNGTKYFFWIRALDRFCNRKLSAFSQPDSCVVGPTSITQTPGEIPKSFALYQNYPNPFNPETKIKFDLPKASFVKIVVYDLLGREVVKLFDGKKEAGAYEVTFNGTELASGIYIYKMVTPFFNATKRFVLIK